VLHAHGGGVLTQSSAAELNVANVERPKVIYNPTITIDVAAGTITGVAPPVYRITNRNSGKCLDVASGSTADGAKEFE
jgi:hypothetical protein